MNELQWLVISMAVVVAGLAVFTLRGKRTAPDLTKRMSAEDDIGLEFGRYRVDQRLKSGRTWHAYLASSVNGPKGRFVIKLLRTRAIERGIDMKAWLAAVEGYTGLQHPAILSFVGWGQDHGRWFLVQPYSEALPMRSLLEAAPLPLDRVSALMDAIFDVVIFLHHNGIVHSRLSLDRIYVLPDDSVQLWDMGLQRNRNKSVVGYATMMEGLARMAPDADPTERRDQFLTGRVAWELLAGRNLLQDKNPIAAAHKLLNTPGPRVTDARTDVPPTLADVVARMMELSPEDRYPSMEDARAAWKAANR